MEKSLKIIYDYAKLAHGDQERKFTYEPYINHCVRVMEICRTRTNEFTILAAALLHDVLEDTPITESEMRDFLVERFGSSIGDKVTELVVDLSDVYTRANYPELNRKTRKARETERMADISPDAQTVKYADIIDNSVDIAQNDKDFARIFLREGMKILDVMQEGDADLYERARKTVKECLAQVKKDKV